MVDHFIRLCSGPPLNHTDPFHLPLAKERDSFLSQPGMDFFLFYYIIASNAAAKPHALKLKWLLAEHWIICDSKSISIHGLETTVVK